MDKEIRAVAFCPHCGNKAPQKLIHTQHYDNTWYSTDTGEISEGPGGPSTYYVATCETCNEVLLYLDALGEFEPRAFNFSDLVWPESGLHGSVPSAVASCYSEAERIKNLAPNAFAAQIRKALEAICDDRGAKAGPLQYRLKELVTKGEIPAILADMSDALRTLGNVGAHTNEQGIKPIQVRAIDDFFRAIVEYVYVAPNKLAEFRKGLSRLKKKA